jgi:GT2 family glycosyltransferase
MKMSDEPHFIIRFVIMSPKVIVLILSYNGKSLLQDSISSYLNNHYTNFEVVVVDNASTDGTIHWVQKKYPSVYVLRTEKDLKYSGGFNFGMRYAFGKKNADYVLITNNDVIVDENIISELVKVAQQSDNIGFTIGKVYYYNVPNTLQTVGKRYHTELWNAGHMGNGEIDKGQYDKIEERDWCDDIYWLIRREVWEKTGGYDTEFAYQGEDFDWQVRAKMLGYKIMYTPHAKLWHKESMTIGLASAFKAYYDARNPLIIHMKYRNKEEYLKIIRMHVLNQVKIMPKYIIKGKLWHIIKMWQGLFSAIFWGVQNNRLP